MTHHISEVSNVATEQRVVVPSSNQGTPSFGDVATEIKSGLWAIVLAGVVVWIATAKAREAFSTYFTEYVRKQISLLDVVKETSTENNKLIKEILVKVDEASSHTKSESVYRSPHRYDNLGDD